LLIAAAAAAKFPLEVEQPGVRRPAVLQQPGVDVGPLSAGRTGREDQMPGAEIVEPDGMARRYVLVLFHVRKSYARAGLRAGAARTASPSSHSARFVGDTLQVVASASFSSQVELATVSAYTLTGRIDFALALGLPPGPFWSFIATAPTSSSWRVWSPRSTTSAMC
jgi:hypothetical protein